jgi:hypothetical protein
MLLRGEQRIRNYTLQEGYQSCEAGHGEGGACTRKPAPGAPGGVEVPPTGVTWPAVGRDYAGLRLMTEQYVTPHAFYFSFSNSDVIHL